MAQAFPNSTFVGSDYHDGLDRDGPRAGRGGRRRRPREVRGRAARPRFPGDGYDLVTMFDCLHDMGDPVGAARQVRETLAPDGTWLIVEPMAGDRVEDNLNPVGRAYYGFSTFLCTPASLSQEVGLALGAQAGEARIRDVVSAGGFTPLPPGGRDAVQPGLRGAAVSDYDRPRGPERHRDAGARCPDEQGVVERDGVRVHWEAYGDGGPTILLLPTWSIVHSRHLEDPDPLPRAALPRRHVRRARQRAARTGRTSGGLRRAGVRRRRRRRARRRPASSRACVVGLSLGGLRGAAARRRPPRARRRRVPYRSGGARCSRRRRRTHARARSTTSSTDYEGWAKYNRHYWLRDYRGFLEFFFAQVFPEPHSTKQIEDGVAWGLDTTPETLILTESLAARASPTGRRSRRSAARVRCPVLVVHGSDDADHPARARRARSAELTGGELVALEGSGHAPHGPRPVRVNLLLRDFAERVAGEPPPPRDLGARASPAAARAVRLLADRPRPRLARRRDRRRAAPPAPGPRDRVARAGAGHHACCASAARRSTRPAPSSPARPRTSTARRASTTCTRSRRSAGWTRSSARTSWSSTTSCARRRFDVWIGDEAWEVDHFLHENPELKTAPYVVADRLRRLPADAGRRRARGVPDRRLQRRDDRARRALSRASATGRSSSATPRTSSPGTFGPACRRSATGPSATTASPATSPASTRGRSPTGRRSAPSSATATSRSAWSRSAARASARRCCGA